MRRIVIVGAGQAGLQLGVGLLDAGYQVTVVSSRSAERIRDGRVMSGQCMFGSALARERSLGLGFWDRECPAVEGIAVRVADGGGGTAVDWAARFDLPAQAVDQRLKMSAWMAEFERRGGRVEHAEAEVDDLEDYAADADLVVVAAGKAEIAKLFPRDDSRSAHDAPQRALALTYVRGLRELPDFPAVSFNVIPGVGEYFVFPGLTTNGPCDIMVFEGVPGGPMDCWDDVRGPAEHLARSKWVLDTFVPWEAARAGDVSLTDDNGILAGRLAPTVRHPVGVLPSGAPVLGMADVVVLNDPITGQGSNNAGKCAASYLRSIVEHGDRPFDAEFMREAFEVYWDYARFVTDWTNALLDPSPHMLELIGAAGGNKRIARRFVNGFDDPRDFHLWFMDADAAAGYLGGR
ncbi:styrene monooxygenase/indole monooxygenase family protein [Saccharopolyspora taberi]|uniref:Styrene monooxygenase StyA putative substrate binding domain-containing protein n=1 Tax=Saccharopolyspora taberi TaxID=60895 RepID=A0ABN3VEF9_9PSEU